MHPRVDPSPALLRLAAAQHGVVAADQAAADGLGRHSVARLVGHGQWRRLDPGVYLTHPQPPEWPALAWAGTLIGGEGSRIGGAAAGYLSRVLDEPPEAILVLVPRDTYRTDRGPWRFLREQPGLRVSGYGRPPRISVEDAVLDLCAETTPEGVVDLIARSVQRRRTTPPRLLRSLDRRGRLTHAPLIREVLAGVAGGAESPLELRYLRCVERAHGLPSGRRQARLGGGQYGDVLYEDYQTLAELDGRIGHEGSGRFRDMDRDNRALVTGLVTLRFGWHDVAANPCRVARQVAAVLHQRGWPGPLRPCRRCGSAG